MAGINTYLLNDCNANSYNNTSVPIANNQIANPALTMSQQPATDTVELSTKGNDEEAEKKGLSTGAKIGIGAAIATGAAIAADYIFDKGKHVNAVLNFFKGDSKTLEEGKSAFDDVKTDNPAVKTGTSHALGALAKDFTKPDTLVFNDRGVVSIEILEEYCKKYNCSSEKVYGAVLSKIQHEVEVAKLNYLKDVVLNEKGLNPETFIQRMEEFEKKEFFKQLPFKNLKDVKNSGEWPISKCAVADNVWGIESRIKCKNAENPTVADFQEYIRAEVNENVLTNGIAGRMKETSTEPNFKDELRFSKYIEVMKNEIGERLSNCAIRTNRYNNKM